MARTSSKSITVLIQQRVEFVKTLHIMPATGYGADEVVQLLNDGGEIGKRTIKDQDGKTIATFKGEEEIGSERYGEWELDEN